MEHWSCCKRLDMHAASERLKDSSLNFCRAKVVAGICLACAVLSGMNQARLMMMVGEKPTPT